MTTPFKLRHRLFYFTLIGITAALVHLFTVYNLVAFLHIHALIANVFAFFIAFNVSYLGHKYLTFSQLTNQKILSLPHYFAVAASAGMINEILYFFMLRYTSINYFTALILVLGLVSIYNYTLSKLWACRSSKNSGLKK